MKQLLLIFALVALVGCGESKEEKAAKAEAAAAKAKATAEAKAVAEAKEESEKIIEAVIRRAAKKPTGELTKADLEKVTEINFTSSQLTSMKGLEKLTKLTRLILINNQLTDVKGLEKLTKLERLVLTGNPDLTKAQIAKLQKELPKCLIFSDHDC
ncbi:MAG: leucine-rich repeat domain-containing protein [Verrucomicrobiota bacterium]|nr:leucine-rich repeat domain-containing protein [Verrucomicrobiota bacterium]